MTFALLIESIDGKLCVETEMKIGNMSRYTLLKKGKSYDTQYLITIRPIITFRNKFYQSYELLALTLYIQELTMYISTNDNSLTERLEGVITNKYGKYLDVPSYFPIINLSSLLATSKNYEFKENPFRTFDELSNDVKALIQDFLSCEN